MPDGSSAQQAHGVPNQLPGLSRLQHTLLFPWEKKHTPPVQRSKNKMSWNNTEPAWKMDCMWERGKGKSWNGGHNKAESFSLQTSFKRLWPVSLNCRNDSCGADFWGGCIARPGVELRFRAALIYQDGEVCECTWAVAAVGAIAGLSIMCYK